MNNNYPQKRLEELEKVRLDVLDRIAHFEKQINDCRAEIDIIDIRYADAEEFAREWPKEPEPVQCVPAPSTKIKETSDTEEKRIHIKETSKPEGISTPVNTPNVIGDRTSMVYFLQKKNEHGMPDNRNRLVISTMEIDNFVAQIKKRGKVHFDDTDGINVMKYSILVAFLDDSRTDYANVKYTAIGNNGNLNVKKYLVWDES